MTTQADVDAVRSALIKLASGRATSVVVDRDGQRVEFHKGDIPTLTALMRQLQAEVTASSIPRPIGVVF